MFRDMNRGFDAITDFEPARPPQVGRRVVDFLARFDAIFTLNQDLLLERHYKPPIGPPRNWSGVAFPGLKLDGPAQPFAFLDQRWRVDQTFEMPHNVQPIFKLHGSSNWISNTGAELLIIGGDKSQHIQSHAILKRYREIFVEHLNKADTRLMVVIGYSFSDDSARGVALGTASHGIATARALAESSLPDAAPAYPLVLCFGRTLTHFHSFYDEG